MDNLNIPQQNFSGTVGGGELSLYQYFMASPLFAEFKDFNSPERKLFLSDYSKMSPNMKNFFASVQTATDISTVGLKHQLDDNQISAIAGTIREVMTGRVFIKDFSMTISSKLGIDDVKASDIVNTIVSKSFSPIIEDLKRIQRTKFPDKIQQMQKESRPETLTQPSARPITNPPPITPAQRMTNQAPIPPVQPRPAPPPLSPKPVPPPPVPPLKPSVPPLSPPVAAQPPRPIQQAPLASPPPRPMPAPPKIEVKPEVNPQNRPPVTDIQPPKKPEFKIPDLGQSFSTIQGKPLAKPNEGEKSAAQKSLEAELEKVAGVIDLRNKPKE